MTDEQPDSESAELTRAAAELTARIGQLTGESTNQFVELAQASRTNRRLIIALAISFALDIALTITMVIGVASIKHNSERIGAVTRRLDIAQTTGRTAVLCPLYKLFLDSQSPRARAAYPQGPAAYDRAFKVIRDGYNTLDCR